LEAPASVSAIRIGVMLDETTSCGESMKNKYICIHGHFYQPPRENPWLDAIELQDSAYPYQDWNQRVTAECYAPNVASRILDRDGDIVDIINNYAKMSFNFGPTLLHWLEREDPDIYLAILKADKSSQHFFSGHGSAIAQAYNHMILPLANERDKRTQVIWGIKDFEFRFKRRPEGMWLPETAVDTPTLEVLAEQEIRYTILTPYQAKAVRRLGEEQWRPVEGAINAQEPYLCRLPSGKTITIFFYDGQISHDIAFAGLLNNGEALAKRFLDAFPENMDGPRLVNAATDGETYGHHHRFGNMALSYGFHHIEKNHLARLTVFGEYLERHSPQQEVQIKENSSWSCAHGVERWRSDCGCCIGGHPWKQAWRKPLREAMDWLRDELVVIYEKQMKSFAGDPWLLRDLYIEVVLDRDPDHVRAFFTRHIRSGLSGEEEIRLLKLLEMQRHAMFMFTSCGWFFDEVSGIEAVQIMQYAARAIQLAREVGGKDLTAAYLERLKEAKSNITEYQDAAYIYQKYVHPHVTDLLHVGAHLAISSLFQPYPDEAKVYCYDVGIEHRKLYEVGKHKLLIGKARIRSGIVWEEGQIDFAVLHFGDYNINCGVRFHQNDAAYVQMHDALVEIFIQNNIPDVIQMMLRHFGQDTYSLWDLFKNEQGKVLEDIFENTLEAIETNFREIYEHYYPLMHVRPDFRIPLPKALAMSVEFVLSRDLIREIEQPEINLEKMERLIREIRRWSFTRDKEAINLAATQKLDWFMTRLTRHSRETKLLHLICEFLRVCHILPLNLNVWRAQNIYFSMAQRLYPKMKGLAEQGDEDARVWMSAFEQLSKFLKVHSP